MEQNRTKRDARESVASESEARRGPRLVLLDERSDHRELFAEELASILPQGSVAVLAPDAPLPASSRLVLVSLGSDPQRVVPWLERLTARADAPRLVFLSGENDLWATEAERRWPGARRLDKREGLSFLTRLRETVEEWLQGSEAARPESYEARATREASTAATARDAPSPPPPETDEQAGTRAEGATGPATSPEFERLRRELLLASVLAGDVGTILQRLEALAELFRHRVPGDAAVDRYASCLRDEVARARAAAARIAALGRPDATARETRLVSAADLVRLRVAAWRSWLPKDAEIQIHVDERAPRVAAWPDVIGPMLDEVVGLVVRGDESRPRLTLRAECTFRESDHGVSRWTRLEIAGSPREPARAAEVREMADEVIERARTAMAAHGGVVEHAGLDTGGAAPRVVLLFPAALPAAELEGQPGASANRAVSPPAKPTEQAAARVLVVDDDDSVREIAREMLDVLDHESVGVSSGEAAIELFENGERFDLVLLDMQMGGIDGRRTFNELRRIDPDLRVILVSGSATGTELRSLLGEGLLGYLPKPFSVAKLKEIVEAALRDS